MSSMWAKYKEERGTGTVIETEKGFICFSIGNRECFIQDCYVLPEFREKGEAVSLMNQVRDVALKSDCLTLTMNISVGINGSNRSLKCCLDYGFEVMGVAGNVLILSKVIRG